MFKVLTTLVIAVAFLCLSACSQSAEEVDVTTLWSTPEKFSGKRVKFFLYGVGAIELSTDGYLHPRDRRIGGDYKLQMRLSPTAREKFAQANLDPNLIYTMTFSGEVTQIQDGTLILHEVLADDFVINAEEDFAVGIVAALDRKGPSAFPTAIVQMPRPTTVTDLARVGLFPDEFKGKSLRIRGYFSKEDFKPGQGNAVELHAKGITFVMNKEVASSVYDKVQLISSLELVGRLESQKAADGTPKITVDTIKISP